jgi:hypothetical protein
MAVQASKSDLIEFIVKILRMGAGFICRAPSCSAFISSDFRAPRLRAGHPGDRALTFAHDKCSASELRLNDIRRFCVGGPAFCNCCPATLIFAEIAANLHGGARFVDE